MQPPALIRLARVVGRVAWPAALLCASCTVGPDYERPVIETPMAWRDTPVAETETLANIAWWDLFHDPAMQALIRTALDENQDYRIAVERIVEFQARLGFTEAELYPRVDVGGKVGQFEQSRLAFPPNPSPGDNDSKEYRVTADLFWELDLFGRIRRASEAERELLLASEEARVAVAITLVADVGQAYVRLRDFDQRLEIARRTLQSRAESVELARIRFEGEVTSETDWRQAQAEYFRVQAIVFELERQVRLIENELSVLVGRNPGDIARGLAVTQLAEPPAIPAGLPSELLERRPDLLQAEHELHAATADIGAAKALLFPRIALTASTGYESSSFDDLFDSDSRAWSLAGNLLQPIFNAGQNRDRITIQESQMRQTLYGYERAVLIAFREVEDALVGCRTTGQSRIAQHERVEAEREVLRLVDLRYRGGVTDYLDVLDAQRSLFTAELDEVATISDQYQTLIRLYKALGGGWPATPAEPETDATGDATSDDAGP